MPIPSSPTVYSSCFYHQNYQQKTYQQIFSVINQMNTSALFQFHSQFHSQNAVSQGDNHHRNLQQFQSPFPPSQKPTAACAPSAIWKTCLKQEKQGMRNNLFVLFSVYLHMPLENSALAIPIRFRERTAYSVESDPTRIFTEKNGSMSMSLMGGRMALLHWILLRTIARQSSPLSQFWMRMKLTGSQLYCETSNLRIWFIGLAIFIISNFSLPNRSLTNFNNSTINVFRFFRSVQKKLKGVSQTIPSNFFSSTIRPIKLTAAQNREQSLPMAWKKLASLASTYTLGTIFMCFPAFLMAETYDASQLCQFSKIG